ncbi:MAG: cation diffusion facilitator family transporter [Alphaproteobacteria bacterium]|nr:cation diffusion facilitator family transporter [Alphaproteobacteria bacterium]
MTHAHDHHHHGPHGHAHINLRDIADNRLRRIATFASVSVAILLVGAKMAAWLMTDSVAMLSSLLDSAVDLMASLVTAYGVANAMRPPDRNHRYGHGKAEPLAALLQAAFIVGSSVLLAFEAASRFYHPHEIQNEMIGYGVMALAIILSLALVAFQSHVVKSTGSMAIGADRMHYVGDVAVNLAVVVSFVLYTSTGIAWLDPVLAVGIAAWLLLTSLRIMGQAMNALMDTELPEAERERIIAIVTRQSGVRGVHDMRTRSDSDRIFVDMHVEMNGDLTLRAAHDLSEKIIRAVNAEIPNADMVIHQDPAGLVEDRRDEQIERAEAAEG